MKAIFPLLLAGGLSVSMFAQEVKTNAAPDSVVTASNLPPPVVTLSVSDATVTAPLVLTNGVLSQSDMTSVEDGGKAVFAFAITNEGDYVITGQVNAPDDSSNSFFVNVDAQPDDTMIWDIDVTTGLEERVVSWRGDGDGNNDEFSPKKFHLTAGSHKLILVGREPTDLKSLAIHPAPK